MRVTLPLPEVDEGNLTTTAASSAAPAIHGSRAAHGGEYRDQRDRRQSA
jgi:hypothetical protein